MIARRLLFALPLLPMLGGCGWEPLYANRAAGPASAELRTIKVAPISERIGQRLEMALRRALNPDNEPAPTKYQLIVTLSTSVGDLGIQSEGLGTRGEVAVTAGYQLVDVSTKAAVQSGSVHATESFDIQANGYSTVVAQNDAYVRTIGEIQREIVTRLTLLLQKKALAAS